MATRPRPRGVTDLLPQPDGFQGLFTGPVLVATRDLSVADCYDVSDDLICFDTAEPGASAESFNHDHRIPTGVDQFHRLHPIPVEHVDPVLEPCPEGILAMDRTGLVGSTLDCPVDDIVGEMLHVPIKPSTGKCLVGPAHDLHVLLRHRPPSIPWWLIPAKAHLPTTLLRGKPQSRRNE